MKNDDITLTAEEARQGHRVPMVRRILLVSTVGAVVALAIAWYMLS